MSNGADLPDDVDALKAMLLEARASISQMQQDMAERDLEIEMRSVVNSGGQRVKQRVDF